MDSSPSYHHHFFRLFNKLQTITSDTPPTMKIQKRNNHHGLETKLVSKTHPASHPDVRHAHHAKRPSHHELVFGCLHHVALTIGHGSDSQLHLSPLFRDTHRDRNAFVRSSCGLGLAWLIDRRVCRRLFDRKLRQTRHFNGGKDSKKFPKVLALAHYESECRYFYS